MTARPGPPEPSAGAAAMTGWAQLLHDVVERRLRPDGPTDLLAPSWDGLFDDAFAAVLREMLADRLAALTPAEFVATYRSVHGDAALLTELSGLVATRERAAARERSLQGLAVDARRAGRLRLGALDVDDTFDVGLFDPSRPDLACWRCRDDVVRRPLHRVVRVRLTRPATGEARVVSDTWTGAVWADRWRTPTLAPMTAVRIGTRLPETPAPSPELTLHAPVVVVGGDGVVVAPPQLVGYVRTLDGRLLLDAPG